MKRLWDATRISGGLVVLLACFVAFLSPFAPVLDAWAGESLLGKLVVNDGGTTTNRCTGWSAYAGAGAFVVSPLSKITIQCDGIADILTDVGGCDAGACLRVVANEKFPTSVNTNKTLTCKAYNSDGGTAGVSVTYTGGWVAMSPDPATAAGVATTCKVYARTGTE